MQEAICDGKSTMTAFALREAYLKFGTRFTAFKCAGCGVELEARAVYGERFKKIAYFALPKGMLHRRPCHPKGGMRASASTSNPSFVHGRDVVLPGKLDDPRLPRAAGARSTLPTDADGEGGAEANAQRGVRVVENQGSTTLLQVIVEAWLIAKETYYEQAPKDASGTPDHKWVSQMLKQHELTLYKKPTNYDQAFHKFAFPWKGDAIHYGYSDVTRDGSPFFLRAPDGIRVTKDEEGKVLEKPRNLFGRVDIRLDEDEKNPFHDRMLEKLTKLHQSGRRVKWYAFGTMNLNTRKDGYVVHVTSARHIFIDSE